MHTKQIKVGKIYAGKHFAAREVIEIIGQRGVEEGGVVHWRAAAWRSGLPRRGATPQHAFAAWATGRVTRKLCEKVLAQAEGQE